MKSKPKVLLVDDREENLLAFEAVLRSLDCEVISCASGKEAIEYLSKHCVAAVLLDVQMPEMDGIEAAERIRKIEACKLTPILFVTAIDHNESRAHKAYNLGAVDFIYKPADPIALRAKVAFFIELFLKNEELEQKNSLLEQSAESQKTYILEHALDAVVATDEENRVTFWNEHAERLFGWSKSEIMNRDMTNLIIPERFRERHRAGVKRFISTGVAKIQNQRIEIVGLRRSGEEFQMELTVSSLKVGSGYRFYSFMRDISEQKLAQSTVKASEQTLAQIFDRSLSMMVVLRGPDLVFERANAKYFDFLGRKDIIGKPVHEAVPELAEQGFVKILKDVYQTQKPFIGTEVPMVIGKPGSVQQTHYFNFVYQPLIDSGGLTVGIVGQGQDVTENVVARQRIEQNESRAQLLARASAALNSSLDVNVILGELSKVCVPKLADWCSIRMRRPDGILEQVAVAHSDPEKVKWAWEIQNKFPPDVNSKTGPYQVLRTGKSEVISFISDEMIQRSATTDEQRELVKEIGFRSYICSPIKSRNEVIGALTVVTTDESDRRLKQEDVSIIDELASRVGTAVENARLYLESQNINRLKDEFLANLSHELRTPMNVIQGHAELLEQEVEKLAPKDIASSISAISRNARAQTAIIADLLDVSSIITGKVAFQPSELSPAETLESIVQGLQATAAAKGVTLSLELDGAPAKVTADPTRLHQITWNLISNAIKFTGRGGEVKVSVSTDENDWVLTVADEGRGIDPAFLPYVFDRFRQEDATTTRRYGGLGLGLAIVRHLTELHGGQVKAESGGLGKGAKFTVTLPLKSLDRVSVAPHLKTNSIFEAKKSNGKIDLHSVKVLIVDDSKDNRELIRRMLLKAGALVVDADGAQNAREKLRSFAPDVILSDIGMPEEDGIEFITKLRKNDDTKLKTIPAVALTAYVREEEKEAAISAGFQAHVGKPVSPAVLLDTINKVLAEK